MNFWNISGEIFSAETHVVISYTVHHILLEFKRNFVNAVVVIFVVLTCTSVENCGSLFSLHSRSGWGQCVVFLGKTLYSYSLPVNEYQGIVGTR